MDVTGAVKRMNVGKVGCCELICSPGEEQQGQPGSHTGRVGWWSSQEEAGQQAVPAPHQKETIKFQRIATSWRLLFTQCTSIHGLQ